MTGLEKGNLGSVQSRGFLVRPVPRMTFGLRTLTLFLLLPLLLAGCKQNYAWHQEISLTVNTPDGPVSASSVQAVEVGYFPNGGFATGTQVEDKLEGEAVVVDLGAGRFLFALVAGSESSFTQAAYRDLGLGRPEIFQAIEAQLGKPPHPIPREFWPRMVTFADIDDPTSVALVDPDDLAATFGEGYALAAVTIAVTDAPLTQGVVERVLGWLATNEDWIVIPPSDFNDRIVLANGEFDSEWNK